MPPLLYQTYYSMEYRAEMCSCVTITTLFVYIVTLILCFLFVYETNGLWDQETVYYEQPNVKMKNEFLLETLDADGVSSQFSSVKGINDKVMNPLSPPLFYLHMEDDNGDHKADRFKIKINFKNDPRKLRKVRVLSVFDYQLRSKLKIQMQSLIDLNIDTPDGASRIVALGEIQLKQSRSILIDSIVRSLYDVNPLLDVNFEQFDVNDIVDKYNGRSDKVEFDYTQMVQPMGKAFSTTIEVIITVPLSQEIRYRPGVLETLKFGWVQYIMVLVPVLFFLNKALAFLFKYRVLDAQLVSDLRPKRKIM